MNAARMSTSIRLIAIVAAGLCGLAIVGFTSASGDLGAEIARLDQLTSGSETGAQVASGNPERFCRAEPTRDLPPLDLSDMTLYDYRAPWHASNWDNTASFTPWRYDHIRIDENGDAIFRLDRTGAPQLKFGGQSMRAVKGTWEVEVTLPPMRDGLVVAPLWLFNQQQKEEIDFEFSGRRSLDLTIHAYPGGSHEKKTISLFRGFDWSGCTTKFKIVADIPAGWVSMYLDDVLLHQFARDDLGYFITAETGPVIEMWPARDNRVDFVQWVGRWVPLEPREALEMKVHGFRFTPGEPSE